VRRRRLSSKRRAWIELRSDRHSSWLRRPAAPRHSARETTLPCACTESSSSCTRRRCLRRASCRACSEVEGRPCTVIGSPYVPLRISSEDRRGSADVGQCEPLSSELSCLSIRKILPTAGYSSVGDVDNSVSSRAQKQNSTLICYWASAGVGRTIRFAKSVAGHARGNRSAAGDTRGGTRDDTSQCSPDFTSRDLRQSAVGELRPP